MRTGQLSVFIDNHKVAVLDLDKGVKEIYLNADEGSTIWVSQHWCRSNKLKIGKDMQELVLTSFLSNKMFLLILFSTLFFTLIALLTEYIFFGLFPFLIALYPLYFITIGKNHYFRIYKADG